MDNAIRASAYAIQGKAVASAAFGRPSGEMAERADQPTPRGVAAAEGGHIIMGQGAVPIIRNGVVDGACGVSGGTAQQDEDCSPAGVAQLWQPTSEDGFDGASSPRNFPSTSRQPAGSSTRSAGAGRGAGNAALLSRNTPQSDTA